MRHWKLTLLPGILAVSVTPALAAPNFVGQSGNIVTPNDRVMGRGEASAGYRHLDKKVFEREGDMNLFSVNYGLTRSLEAGFAYVERGSNRLLINGKYRLVTEKSGWPSVSVGVVDLTNQLDKNPGTYIVLGQTLNRERWPKETPRRPVNVYLGAGSGAYDGIFGGLNYATSPRMSLMAEYAPQGPLTGRKDAVNLGARYAVSNRMWVEAGLFDFDTVGIGVSFTSGLRLGR